MERLEKQLKVSALSHSFGPTEILRNISFELEPGQVVSVVGPSGGGKTTLLRLCAGLLEVEDGCVQNSFASSSFAFQDPRLLPWKTARENIAFGLKAQGVGKKKRLQLAAEISLTFGLEVEDLKKYPKELSGGMRQRVSFARALVLQPELLFLDEPFSALDIGLKQELMQTLMQLIKEENTSVLFITHDLMEAVRLSDRILLLGTDPGRIVYSFAVEMARDQRSDAFVYEETAKLLSHHEIIKTFELSSHVRQ